MSNTFFEESPHKKYEESSFTWTLNYAETRNKLGNVKYPYTQTFPEIENKWKGLLSIKEEGQNYRVKLSLNAEETIDIKYHVLALYDIDVIDQKQGEITIYKKMKSEDFKCCCILLVPISPFKFNYSTMQIKVNILEEMLEIEKAISETNESKRILKEICGTNTSNEINVIEKTLKNDFKILFENKKFSDFVIKVNDSDEIPVHRTILAARSPVFSAMFENDSLEKNEGYLKITDMDKDTLMLLLNFIYTENIAFDLSAELVKNLLSAADKYDLLDLKRTCVKYFESNLEVSNAIDTLLLSELYIVPELKNRVFEFIIDNKDSFLDPVKFERVKKQYPNLMTELVMKLLVDKT